MAFSLSIEAEDLASVVLPEHSGMKRDRARPTHLRQPDYDVHYDFHTLFYDAFLWRDGMAVRLVGPGPFNLEPQIRSGTVSLLGEDQDETALSFELHHKRKIAYLDIALPQRFEQGPELRLDFGALGVFHIKVNDSGLSLFAHHRVAFTLFKYEPTHWLRDWAYFNAVYHGATALLVYHNDCPNRTTAEIQAELAGIPGIETVVVANWAFPYGPDDGGFGQWDSNFCQTAMLEQMRWRFLARARSVLNSDIDELVVTAGHCSIFEMVEQSPEKYLSFAGHWITGDVARKTDQQRRHRDFYQIADDPKGKPVEAKWAAVPSVFGEGQRWIVHSVSHSTPAELPLEAAALRHFRHINTNWKLDRQQVASEPVIDEQLLAAFKKIGWA